MSGIAFVSLVLWFGASLAAVLGVALYWIKRNMKSPFANIKRYEEEYFYRNPKTDKMEAFPSLMTDAASMDLTVIIPAYNEKDRLPKMLDECVEFLEARRRESEFSYEIIVVDDGSRDNTTEVALEYSSSLGVERVRVLTLVQNRGKGGAIRLGVLSARGKRILFADGDGATKFSDLGHLEEVLKASANKDAIVVGSRAHLEKRAVAERSIFRTFLMKGFHWFVWTVGGVTGIKDTQCGFKLFTRSAASKIFYNLHVERWVFDIELLYIGEVFKMDIHEVAVNWQEIEGSKLIPIFSWIQMALDILRMRIFYMLGIWKIDAAVTGQVTRIKNKSV
ncbi:Dolichyl-phosphate beta-glucosyltransferase [Hypsibius exemplaris]|uniref:Dolichyl-phosphate beta-glucosyltransferase n=1 Tax=Hypsibius exemplaris TaxID=2072580 RepID=A0A1W0WY49_HYPEX|nr:Dolichyl-phosphate beta-glucosyltransferase [Hypsibius exemplaris]